VPVSEVLYEAIQSGQPSEVTRVLDANPALKKRLNDPLPGVGFGQTALMAAVQQANRDMVDVLLRAGADINQKSHWWAGPFHVLDVAPRVPWMPSFLIGRGASLEIHHAVRLEMVDDVRRMLAEDPSLIHQRGGDGQLPLHLAQTVDMAEYLVSRGADINARDIDHESTAAQYMIRDRQPVARYLVRRGCQTDILMAAALGEAAIAKRLLDVEPAAIRTAVSPRYFPMSNPRAGGTIYIWTLGSYKTAHEVAREFGHPDLFDLLIARTPDPLKLAIACQLEDEALVRSLAGRTAPAAEDRGALLGAARSNRTKAVRMMLTAGWPAGADDEHGATALHWAGFHGNVEMARVLLEHGARTDVKEREHGGTPIEWAEFGVAHSWERGSGDYPAVLELLRR